MIGDIGVGAMTVCAVSVLAGAIVQRLTGQGFGMLAAPVIALFAPQMLPGALLLLGVVVGWRAALADRRHIDFRELPWGMAGRAAGAVVAAYLARRLIGTDALGLAVALIVFLAIALSLGGLRVRIAPLSLVGAGFAAGIMGTLTAIGAPPMAMLYQYEARDRSAAMQNTFFLFGMAISIAALAGQGLIEWPAVRFALYLVPFVGLGLWIAGRIAPRAAAWPARAVALSLSGAAAGILLIQSV